MTQTNLQWNPFVSPQPTWEVSDLFKAELKFNEYKV